MSGGQEDIGALLSDSLRRYIGESYTFEQRAHWLKSPAGFSESAWRDYASFGWLALRLPEDRGGIDADFASIAAMMESVGMGLLLEPVFASAIVSTGLLLKAASAEQRIHWLPSLADGSLKLAFAHEQASGTPCVLDCAQRLSGSKLNVLQGDIADALIVSCQDSGGRAQLCFVAADAPGLRIEAYRLVDGRGAARLHFDAVPASLLPTGDAQAHIDDTLDEAAVALCAEASGIIDALLAITTQYLKDRKQFGKPIGSNQALQHRATEMYLLKQEARALTHQAERLLARPPAERAAHIAGARAYIIGAARRVANEAVQMHGGVGITEELSVSHYFRRLMVNAALFDTREAHFERFLAATEPTA